MLVFPSNPPIEYGNSTSGLVSIYTSDELPESNYHYITLSLANIGAYVNRKIKNKSSVTAFTNYQPSAVFINLNQESLRDLKDFNTVDAGIYFVHKINNRTGLKIFNYTNTEGFGFNLKHPSFNGLFNQSKKRNFTVANFTRKNNQGEFIVNGGLSFSNEAFNYGNTEAEMNKTDYFLGVNYMHFFNNLSVKSGISIDTRKLDFKGVLPMFNYAINYDHPVISIDYNTKVPVPEAFTYFKYKLTPSLVLGAGLRKNIPVDDQKNYLTCQINMNYNLNKYHSFNISVGKYNKYNAPNGEVYETHLIKNNQASLDYNLEKDKIEIKSSVFVKKSNITNKEENISGGEVFAKIRLTGKLETQCSYTYLNVRVSDDEKNEYAGNYDMDYFIRASLKYSFINNLSVSAIGLFRQGELYLPVTGSEFDNFTNVYRPVYETSENKKRLPAYSKADLSISKLFSIKDNTSIIIFFNVSNILNTNNVRQFNYNADYSEKTEEYYSKRTVYFGGMVNF